MFNPDDLDDMKRMMFDKADGRILDQAHLTNALLDVIIIQNEQIIDLLGVFKNV